MWPTLRAPDEGASAAGAVICVDVRPGGLPPETGQKVSERYSTRSTFKAEKHCPSMLHVWSGRCSVIRDGDRHRPSAVVHLGRMTLVGFPLNREDGCLIEGYWEKLRLQVTQDS